MSVFARFKLQPMHRSYLSSYNAENLPPRTFSIRQKSARKVGGQPGHEGKELEMTQTPDEIIGHRSCFCPEYYKDLNNQPYELFKDKDQRRWFTLLA